VAGCAGGWQVKNITQSKHPETARRELIDAKDERNQAIRFRAGSKVFEITLAFSYLTLLIYSFVTGTSPSEASFDLFWWFMVVMTVGPSVLYGVLLARYQNRF
jgi:hypothetical protein